MMSKKETNHIRIVPAGKFLKLFKKDSLYQTPIFRRNKDRKNLYFIIVFKLDDKDSLYVLNRSKLGYSDNWQRIKTFTPSQLYQALLAVPHRGQISIQILQVPSDRKNLKSYITYYEPQEIDRLLSGKIADADTYDPFRDAHSALFHKEHEGDNFVPKEDYQGIQDFHPFLRDGDQVFSLPCFYQDPVRKMTIKLQLMGWYYLDKQLKISWKPDNQSNARWRSSLLAIDRKTRRYFFQGNIYQQKGTDPVFLEYLQFDAKDNITAQQEFHHLIEEIKKQERLALMKMR
ncbi:hypothetical protein AB6M97_00780 [Streptococcus hillyeri]